VKSRSPRTRRGIATTKAKAARDLTMVTSRWWRQAQSDSNHVVTARRPAAVSTLVSTGGPGDADVTLLSVATSMRGEAFVPPRSRLCHRGLLRYVSISIRVVLVDVHIEEPGSAGS